MERRAGWIGNRQTRNSFLSLSSHAHAHAGHAGPTHARRGPLHMPPSPARGRSGGLGGRLSGGSPRARALSLDLPPRARPAADASPPSIVGMGSVGLDYLAAVAAFPKPDDKLRTERLEVRMEKERGRERERERDGAWLSSLSIHFSLSTFLSLFSFHTDPGRRQLRQRPDRRGPLRRDHLLSLQDRGRRPGRGHSGGAGGGRRRDGPPPDRARRAGSSLLAAAAAAVLALHVHHRGQGGRYADLYPHPRAGVGGGGRPGRVRGGGRGVGGRGRGLF